MRTLAEQMASPKAAPPRSELPGFRAGATRQLDRHGQDAFDEMRARVHTAFAASQPVTDRRFFAGRTQVLDRLIRATEDLRLHTVLYGERGLGKTSILHMLARAAHEARYIVIYISCGGRSAFDEVVRSVAAQIPLLYCRGISPVSQDIEAGKTFADLLPAGRLSPQVASETLSRITGTRVLVVLDEFDQCQSRDFRLSIAELLKSLSDRGAHLQFLIAGVAANLTELIEHLPSIQRNIFAFQLQRMSRAELHDLIRNGEAVTGMQFETEAEGGIVEVANGLPYFASLLSCYAGLRALDDRRSSITFNDLLGATSEAIEQFGGRLSQQSRHEIGKLTSGELEVLGLVAGPAQTSAGTFSFRDIQISLGTDGYKELVASLASRNTVLQPDTNAGQDFFRFKDETVIPYIWFFSALKRLQQRVDDVTTDAALENCSGSRE